MNSNNRFENTHRTSGDTSLIGRDQDLSIDLKSARENVYRSNTRLERALDQLQGRILTTGDQVDHVIDRVDQFSHRIGDITNRGRDVIDRTKSQATELRTEIRTRASDFRTQAAVPMNYVKSRPAFSVGALVVGGAALFWAYRRGYITKLMANRHRIPELRDEFTRIRGEVTGFVETMNRSPLVHMVIERVRDTVENVRQPSSWTPDSSSQGPVTFDPRVAGDVSNVRKTA